MDMVIESEPVTFLQRNVVPFSVVQEDSPVWLSMILILLTVEGTIAGHNMNKTASLYTTVPKRCYVEATDPPMQTELTYMKVAWCNNYWGEPE